MQHLVYDYLYLIKMLSRFPTSMNTEVPIKTSTIYFIESNLADNFNVILVSHAMHDKDTDTFNLVNAGGAWGKKGGVLSEVDQAIFVEIKGKKRVVHLRNPAMAARTTMADMPDKVAGEDFSLQDHLDLLSKSQDTASSFAL